MTRGFSPNAFKCQTPEMPYIVCVNHETKHFSMFIFFVILLFGLYGYIVPNTTVV